MNNGGEGWGGETLALAPRAPSDRPAIAGIAVLLTAVSLGFLAWDRTHPNYMVWRISWGYGFAVLGTVVAMWAFADDV